MSNRPIIGVTVGTPLNPNKFGGTSDYPKLENKPKINGVELNGDMSLEQLGINELGVRFDDTLKFDEQTRILSVNTADKVEGDNTRPISAAAVHTEIGNIETLLSIL